MGKTGSRAVTEYRVANARSARFFLVGTETPPPSTAMCLHGGIPMTQSQPGDPQTYAP
jgi:hypothetical protein